MKSTILRNNEVITSIIIVNYNGIALLSNCLDSIKKNISNGYEVIVVDNASHDGSPQWISKHYPWVQLICSSRNLGFTGGNNLGAMHAKGEYLLLLNNDTVVNGSFQPLIDIMQGYPGVGAIGCQLRYGNNQLQESIGYEHTPLNIPLSWLGTRQQSGLFRRTIHRANPIYTKEFVEAAWVSGACLMTRKKLWQKLEGLDDRYFMYIEDVDYCKRIRMEGFKVVYTNDVIVTHFEGGGRIWIGERALLNTIQSYKIYIRKFYGVPSLIVMALTLCCIFIMRAALYRIYYSYSSDDILAEKSISYFRAAYMLMTNNHLNIS